jgi:hypothetical protein
MPLPKLAWDFNGTTTDYVTGLTGTVRLDTAGQTGGSVSYISGKYNQSLQITNAQTAPFQTGNNYVYWSIPSNLQINKATTSVSVCFWAYFDNFTASPFPQQTLLVMPGTGKTDGDLRFEINPPNLTFSTVSSITGSQNAFTGGAPIGGWQSSVWYHICGVFVSGPGTVQLYVNGSPVGTPGNNPLASEFSLTAISLGRYPVTGGYGYMPFSGSVDDLRIFDRALTSAQVQSIYNQQGVPGRGVVGYTLPSGPASIIGNVISSNVYTAGRQPDTSVAGQTTYSNVGSFTFTNFGTNIYLTPTTTGLSVSTYFAYTAAPYGGEGLWSCRLTSSTAVNAFARQTGSSDSIFGAYNSDLSSNNFNIPQVSGYNGNRAAWVAGRKDHIVFTFTNNIPVVGRMYINGVLNSTATSSNTFIPPDGNYTCLVPGDYFGAKDANMSVYDFRIVNGILSASQVAMLYRTLSGNNVPVTDPPLKLTGTPLFTQLSPSATSSAVGAFSLRAVNGTSARAVQVRNGTTSATQDFYADRLGNLLTAPVTGQSLANWLGGATGYVTTWYDQSGRGNHASQGTAANQPIIQRATKGPGYMVVFNGVNGTTNFGLNFGTYNLLNNTSYSTCGVVRRTASGATNNENYYLSGSGGTNAQDQKFHSGYRTSTVLTLAHFSDDMNVTIPAFTAAATEPINYNLMTLGTDKVGRIYSYSGGTLYPTPTSTRTYVGFLNHAVGTSFSIGGGFRQFTGEIYELLVFTQSLYDLDTSGGLITKIYQNQLSYTGA